MTNSGIGFTQAAVAIQHFRLVRVQFLLAATTALQLPPYKGSTFRGGFGHALKEVACADPEAPCQTCQWPEQCAYSYLFETSLQKQDGGEEAVPRPYVMSPPMEPLEHYAVGDLLSCELILAGDAIPYLPLSIAAMQHFGRTGIGKGAGRFRIVQVQCLPPGAPAYELYCGHTHQFTALRAETTGHDLLSTYQGLSVRDLTLEFLTPVRLKHKSHLLREAPPFHALMRRLLDRIAEFSLYFHDTPLKLDMKAWKRQSETIRTAANRITHYDWKRYSNRQNTRIKSGGIIGQATYTGEVTPFLPLLALGESLHVGKGATLGLGKYRMVSVQ